MVLDRSFVALNCTLIINKEKMFKMLKTVMFLESFISGVMSSENLFAFLWNGPFWHVSSLVKNQSVDVAEVDCKIYCEYTWFYSLVV